MKRRLLFLIVRKKVLLLGALFMLCLVLCGCDNKYPKDDTFFETYLFSDYSGIRPQKILDEDDFSSTGVIREYFSKDTNWFLIEEYGKTLESLGFYQEDLSSEIAIVFRYVKENIENEIKTYDVVFIWKPLIQTPFSEGDIENQVQYKETVRPTGNNSDKEEDDADKSIDITGNTVGNKNALNSALLYLQTMAFSRTGLIEQLEYEGYSNSEATYAADNCGADWYEQAALSAKEYLNSMSFSRQGLIEQLEYEGFTYDQATYGVEQNGY